MNVIAGFFDALADRWDELCYHAPEKINLRFGFAAAQGG